MDITSDRTIPFLLPKDFNRNINKSSVRKKVGKNHSGPLPANENVQRRLIFILLRFNRPALKLIMSIIV